MRLTPVAALKLLGRAVYSTEARRKAGELIRDARPDIAYLHNLYSYMSPSPIDACKRYGLPVVMRIPDFYMICAELHLLRDGATCRECVGRSPLPALRHRCLKGSLSATAARVASMCVHNWMGVYRKADLFITPSAFMRETLVEAGYDADRILHLPSFYGGPLQDESGAQEDDYILYFGRIATEKGLDTLLVALAQVRSDVRLILAGADTDGLTARLEAQARELGIADRVQFVGLKGRRELDELIARCLFTVVPSRWYDNCPMSVLESFAFGKPVVGSRIGGIPEQITTECGLLFEPNDAEDLARAMEHMLGDAQMRREMGQAGKRRLATDYAPERHCERLLSIFEDLTHGHDPREVAARWAQDAVHRDL
jgi:glycosyltransferase involved in cell wall biosynthesis